MSQDLSRDPLIGKLTRFTPVGNLDRDALLFAAGRASVPRNQIWKIATAALAASQAAMASVWMVGLPTATPQMPMIAKQESTRPSVIEPPAPNSYAGLLRSFERDELPVQSAVGDPAFAEPLPSIRHRRDVDTQ